MTKVQKWFLGLYLLSTIGVTAIEAPKKLPDVMKAELPYVALLLKKDSDSDSVKDK